ncbi:MAG: PPOX class F420-dependent oxidoreductase [Firmicutes bacterium]|nr:PPOX class F420-dependent oxidoreductase [Bacillota bacterium]
MSSNGALDKVKDILESKGFAHLATVGPEGELHSSPVWFGWDGKDILISQTKTRQKYKNILKNANVAVSILDPSDPYRYAEIRGKVTSITDDPDFSFIDQMAKKYIGQDHYPWHQPGDERVVLHITPEKILGH